MASKITRTPDPNATGYNNGHIVNSDTLGPVRIVTYVSSRHRNGWSSFDKYTISLRVSDDLTINGKTYHAVTGEASAYHDASGNPHGFQHAFAQCLRTDLTPAASKVLGDALTAILNDYVTEHGGLCGTLKHMRNLDRQSTAETLKREAAEALQESERLLSEIEA